MIKLITGKKGTGKTKILVDMINNAVKDTNGDLICIEKGAKLTYDISYKVRLVDADRFAIEGYDAFYGFIAGMFAGNYDIKEIFIDGLYKVARDEKTEDAEKFILKLDEFSSKHEVNFTVSMSDDAALASDVLKKYM